jgi:CubicO group peptidase (beta-lactamase class C family)
VNKVGVIAFLALAVWVHAAEKREPSDIARELRAHLGELSARDRFSGVVLVAKGERILFHGAYGRAAGNSNVTNTVNTQFPLASVSKVFTAVAVLQLAQAGKFSLDARLIDILPAYPNKEVAQKVTVRQLLTHRSGLGNHFGTFQRADFTKHPAAESFLELFANEPLRSEPGSTYYYSNAGYLVLGLIVARASGESYDDYVHAHIFNPAGMRKSACSTNETRGLNAVGGLLSTAEDLHRFSLALQRGTLLNNEFTALQLTGGSGMDSATNNGVRVAGYIGSAPGMSNSLEIYPDLSYTVVILSSTDLAAGPIKHKVRDMVTSRMWSRKGDIK